MPISLFFPLPETEKKAEPLRRTRTTANNVLLLSEVIEIICLQITLWAGGNLKPRAGGSGSGDNVELVARPWRHHQCITRSFFYLFAIPNADTEERRNAANTRSPVGGSHIGFHALLMLLKRSQMDITQLLFCRVVIECGFTPGCLIYFQVVDRTSSQQLTFNSSPTECARVPMGASNCHTEQFPNQIPWSKNIFFKKGPVFQPFLSINF